MSEPYYSRVYTDRPAYADYEPAEKFQAIIGIIMTRLKQHPKAICSYSGGADSDILIDLIETARARKASSGDSRTRRTPQRWQTNGE